MADTIKDLVATLCEFKPGAPLLHYISHARFPNFKALEEDAEVTFPFPFTALVGANGIGKSSVLHALYGMPEGESTAKYWFATAVDPIRATTNPPRYIYGHWHEELKGIVETRKARVYSKKRKYHYWEPTKAVKGDGMEDMPDKPYPRKSADRWNPVERNVTYINLKFVIGAFDRTFNFGNAGDGPSEKYDEMQKGAAKLRRVIDSNRTSWRVGGGRERVFENRLLSQEELDNVSQILGRNYKSARIIKHSLYPQQRGEDTSVIFERGLTYSEAFAGSGEVSIVSIVTQILGAPKYSLILLDEPETSLHPGAQKELLRFLLGQIRKNHHQIVISTHSMEFIEDLPHNAIKVFEDNGSNKTKIINESSPLIALNRLGKIPEKKKLILVEDAIAKVVIEQATKKLHEGERNALDIRICPGGAETILSAQIPSMILSGAQVYAYLDGDKKRVNSFTKREELPPKDYDQLDQIFIDEVGCAPKFAKDGGRDKAGIAKRKLANDLNYMDWVNSSLAYLPLCCPDAIVYEALTGSDSDFKSSNDAKAALRKKVGINLSAEEILGISKYALANTPHGKHIESVHQMLKKWLADN